MDWNKLLSSKRLGKEVKPEAATSGPRSDFTRDYDRIISSSAFRRLQDKTQVFPLAKSDYVRTRLTHSLKVASVGRSLGVLAAAEILKRDSALESLVIPHEVGTIVATACLAHDIGNPPFGHAGESAIQEWFSDSAEAREHRDAWKLPPEEEADLLRFEGNAQGFRILSALQNMNQRGGLQLTCAVLAAFTKYPRASTVDESQSKGISGKKFGCIQTEQELFEELLSAFISAIENSARREGGPTNKARTILGLMPGGDAKFHDMSPYKRAIKATDFVAGMTDTYAVQLYQRIRGISMP